MSARLTRNAAPKRKAATETRETLQSKVDDFLQSGGEIQQIPSGVSGQPSMGAKKPSPFAKKSAPAAPAASEPVAAEKKTA